MSALAEALVAAQRRALASLEKAYVAGKLGEPGEGDLLAQKLAECGMTDVIEADYLRSSLDVIREWGASVPVEQNGKREDDKATDAQRARIRRDLRDKLKRHPDEIEAVAGEPTLTKAKASDLIEAIVEGRYDPAQWAVPF